MLNHHNQEPGKLGSAEVVLYDHQQKKDPETAGSLC